MLPDCTQRLCAVWAQAATPIHPIGPWQGRERVVCPRFCTLTELQSNLNLFDLMGVNDMAATAFVRARIDETLKKEAADVLAGMGLTVSDVVRIALTKIAKEKALPFEMRIPNSRTAETLAKSERGEDVHRAKDAEDLFKQLGI